MLDFLNLIEKTKKTIQAIDNLSMLESLRQEFLGKKGIFNQQINIIRGFSSEIRSQKFLIINKSKKNIEQLIKKRKHILQLHAINKQIIDEKLDITLPGRKEIIGRLHPITCTMNRIILFFQKMGFLITYGPEIEDSYHNFDALNIADYHPARDDQDTFWIDNVHLLRTQTSGVQIRIMKNTPPPIRIISPGRVYRRDFDRYHTPMFHQIEGLLVDENISFNNLKGIIYDFLYDFFNIENYIKIRFRPSYFPFTEPSAEVDVMIKNNCDWLEILGCGMVHPNVLLHGNVNPEIFSGFAFGIGIERLAMLYYGITDLRLLFENDIRFLKQFK